MEGNFPSILNVNVGGFVYTTSLDTLTRDANSMLGAMFSGRQYVAKDTRGNYFIDRDGALFRHILNFLRTSELCLPQSFDEFDQLSAEADFYQIGDLIEALQIFRENHKKRMQLSEGQRSIIVSVKEYQNQLLVSGRKDLVKEVFKEDLKPAASDYSSEYFTDCRVPCRPGRADLTKAVAFDLLYGHGFVLEGCNGGRSDAYGPGKQFQEYIFVRKDKL